MAPSNAPRWGWALVGLAGVVVIVLAVWGVGNALVAQRETPTPTPSPPTLTSPPEVPIPVPTPTETTPSEPSTPSPEPTKTVTPYCAAFQSIKTSDIEATNAEGEMDFPRLSRTLGSLIDKYSQAAALAPPNLKPDYEKALRYMRQGKKAAESQNFKELKTLVRNLSSLNQTMDSIQGKSEQICD